MPPDFPAAHSMDTEWFAIDADGRVGSFWSGENGSVPHGAGTGALDHSDDRLEQGLYAYSYEIEYGYPMPLGVYRRGDPLPARPIHLYELPPNLRRQAGLICFPNVRFADADLVQPAEFYSCSWWGKSAAYLTSDGVTLRAMPEYEKEFFAFVIAWRQHGADPPRRFEFTLDKEVVALLDETGWVVQPVPGREDGFLSLAVLYYEAHPDGPLRFAGIDDTPEK